MTAFDPEFALEVMKRRRGDKFREAGDIHLEKFKLLMDSGIPPWGRAADAFDERIHALWAEADSYDSVIKYLEDRIWSEKTFAEKTWAILESWTPHMGVGMVQDVIEAQRGVVRGDRP